MTVSVYFAVLIICISLNSGYGQQASCSPPQNETCDISTLGCCDKNFRNALNFTSSVCGGSATFADPVCYRRAIENFFVTQGNSGLLAVCEAFNLFKDCLDISMVSCMTSGFYILNGYGKDGGTRTEVLYAQLQFACGPGIQSFVENDCFPSTWNNSRDAIEQCRNNFIEDVNQGGCYASSNLLACMQTPFQKCSKEAGWWICEYSRAFSHIFLPACPGNCLRNEGETTSPGHETSVTVSHERKRRDSETVATELPGSTIHESRKKRNEETTVVTEAPTTAARRKRNDIESTRITETAEESYRKKRHEESTTFASVVEENAEAVAHGDEVNEAARKKRHSEEATKSPEHSEVEEVEKREEGEVVTEEAENDSLKHDNVSRAKRVSHAGSSHKNRPSAVEHLSSNSNSNVNGHDSEEDHEYEFEIYHNYEH